jgi:hypothetical protein
MPGRYTNLSLALLALTLNPLPAGAQDNRLVLVTGRILDAETDRELLGAIVELSGVAERFVSDANGEVTIQVPRGDYQLIARRNGYETLEGDFKVMRAGQFILKLAVADGGDPGEPGRLVGRIVDHETGAPIEGASVSLLSGATTVTDASGRFRFGGVDPGVARIAVEMIGREDRTEPVTVQGGRTTAVEIGLAFEAIELPPITVEVRSRFLELHGVYQRMDRGTSGHVIRRDELDRRVSERLSDSFDGIPGVRVVRRNKNAYLFGRGNCSFATWTSIRFRRNGWRSPRCTLGRRPCP